MDDNSRVNLPDWVLHILVTFFQFLASVGIILILYGIVSLLTGTPWPPVEQIAKPASATLALLGTALTAASIYFYGIAPPPPAVISKRFIAPVILVASVVTIFYVWTKGVPEVIVNGFVILGLAGGLVRIVPRPRPDSN